ncbi:response regulator [Thermithiobacillus tepidarius DSM 3134]|uniref:response regulator n=1 Tax=Thermithiobacillus tepidarius TaxID=929 RepID=UPI000403080B|nr:response regulator [Thermithiobacillus tepidarius]
MRVQTLLLVEDNPDDEALTLRTLKKLCAGQQVVVVRDGVEALDYLFGAGQYAQRQPAELPQVMLLDLNLPRVNGFELLQRLRADARTRTLPVVVLTTCEADWKRVESFASGASSYVCKPVNPAQLSDALRQLGLEI